MTTGTLFFFVQLFIITILVTLCASGALTALIYSLDRDTLRRLNWNSIKVGVCPGGCSRYKNLGWKFFLFSHINPPPMN